jgi:HPr kinase/phosphorylase
MNPALPAHGTLIKIDKLGIYLVGQSGLGKTETALELILMGKATLICDDAPELSAKAATRQIMASCPEKFYGMVHVRDLGLLDLTKLIGNDSANGSHSIDFVVQFKDSESLHTTALKPDYEYWQFNQILVPGISIHSCSKRNTTAIILMATRQFIQHNTPGELRE